MKKIYEQPFIEQMCFSEVDCLSASLNETGFDATDEWGNDGWGNGQGN